MTGLDTNVLVRYILQDDPAQARRATETIESGEDFYLDSVVLAELVWVLDRSYKRSRGDVAEALEKIIRADAFSIDRAELARLALDDYRAGYGDFADALIAHAALDAGCEAVLTFDKGLKRMPGFRQL